MLKKILLSDDVDLAERRREIKRVVDVLTKTAEDGGQEAADTRLSELEKQKLAVDK